MKRCKKNFNPKNRVVGLSVDEFETIYLYNLITNDGKVIYIGITSDVKQTKNRHYYMCDLHNASMVIVGSFYDRKLAEFIEIELIKDYLNNGVELLNKVVEFTKID